MNKKIKTLLFSISFAFMAIFVADIISVTSESGSIMDSIMPQVSAQVAELEEEDPLCDSDYNACGPLMGNTSGTRYCCAGTNSDCCYAAYC